MSQNQNLQEFNVFDYADSSSLLHAYIQHKKSKSRYFSLSGWAKNKVGLPTGGIIVNFIKKRRLPSEQIAVKIAKSMELDAESTQYVIALVGLERAERAESSTAKTFFSRKLKALSLGRKAKSLKGLELKSVSRLTHIAIKEAISLKDKNQDPQHLKNRLALQLTKKEITHALKTLAEHGLLRELSDGTYRPIDEIVQTSTDFTSEPVRAFHRESLTHAIDALEKIPTPLRHFTSHVMPIAATDLPEAKKALDEFLTDYASRFEAKIHTGDEIYQLNLNFIPLTHVGKVAKEKEE